MTPRLRHAISRNVVRPWRAAVALRAARRGLLHSGGLSDADRALLARVSLRLARGDTMYAGDAAHYLGVGLSAARCVGQALAASGVDAGRVRTVLDFPCGSGRVLRFLRVMFPAAAVTAAEIDREARAFCRRAFGVTTAASDTAFRTEPPLGRFDLIWCGSLLTHLDEAGAARLLAFFFERLAPGGVCVVTTHGAFPARALRDGTNPYALTDDARRALLAGYDATGYGYADYADLPGYGVSAVTPARFEELARGVGGWSPVWFRERGWDDHQDVAAWKKAPGEFS